MKTLKHIQKDQSWAEWTDLTPSRIYGSLWGVPFCTYTHNPMEPDLDGLRHKPSKKEVREAIRIIDKADAWEQWYSQAKRLCQDAEV